jgi:hypothetical protein
MMPPNTHPTPALILLLLLLLLLLHGIAAALNLNWAADDTTSFVPHPFASSITLDLISGQAAFTFCNGVVLLCTRHMGC